MFSDSVETNGTIGDDNDGEGEEFLVETLASEDGVPLHVILAMTCGMGGLQVVWATIFSNGTLYLLELGLSDIWTTLIWAIPAICGCFAQPIIGACSDWSLHPWGRRRPYMVVGAVGITSSILVLAWTGDLAHWTAILLSSDSYAQGVKRFTEIYAVLAILGLSLAIQPLQCALRAIILDQCPARQQVQAQGWAARLSGLGQILGCIAGIVYLPGKDSRGEITTFRILAIASITAVDVSVAVTCLNIKEHAVRQALNEKVVPLSLRSILHGLFRAWTDTRRMVRRIFFVQFVAWMGWFGFMFYNTSHTSNLYFRSTTTDKDSRTGGYIGSFVTLLFSCVAFIANALLPFIVNGTYNSQSRSGPKIRFNQRKGAHLSGLLAFWSGGLALSAALMFATLITTDFKATTALVAANGISWAITNWLPFALIGRLTAKLDAHGLNEFEHIDLDQDGSQRSNGIISGLHNVAISAPQILAAGICGVVFWAAREAGSPYGSGWVLGAAGFAYLAASCLAFRLARQRAVDLAE